MLFRSPQGKPPPLDPGPWPTLWEIPCAAWGLLFLSSSLPFASPCQAYSCTHIWVGHTPRPRTPKAHHSSPGSVPHPPQKHQAVSQLCSCKAAQLAMLRHVCAPLGAGILETLARWPCAPMFHKPEVPKCLPHTRKYLIHISSTIHICV